MYPADAPQPYREEALGSGPLDAVTGAYGEGKLAVLGALREAAGARGLRGACVIPTNLFGAGDAFHDPLRAHAAGSLIQRITDAADAGAREVVNWGTGDARREFLFVEDAAEGVVRAAEWMLGGCGASRGVGVAVGGDGSGGAAIGTTRSVVAPGEAPESVPGAPPMVLNLATGVGVSIRELGEVIAGEAGYGGRILWDSTKPDGVAMRVLDPGLARKHLGWAARTPLREAIRRTIAWYRESRDRGARTGTAGGA
jgi:GDP-L-fucose synthase